MTASRRLTILNEKALADWAEQLARDLSSRDEEATVIALSGPLGVGKTTFVQKFLAAYGITTPVTSPTYTIEQVYELPAGPFARAYHLDAYRLDGPDDLAVLGFRQRLAAPENLIIIEWADVVDELLPEHTIFITISFAEAAAEQRHITISHD